MLLNRKEFEKLSRDFLTQFFSLVEDHFQLDVHGLTVDHICWRCENKEDFFNTETTLLAYGSLFHKSEHNGRIISLIVLDTPILFRNHQISLVELPAPKEDKRYPNGFEHAEFVVTEGLENFLHKYPNLPWNSKNIEKAINPDIKLVHEGISIKFHPYTLAHVVKKLEQGKSKIL